MGDITQSRWLLPMLSTRTKVELVELAGMIPSQYHYDGVHLVTAIGWRKDDLRSWIEGCRRLYWDSIPRDEKGRTINAATRTAKRMAKRTGKRAATKRRVPADLCQITAAECNAWLRSLPRGTG